MKKVFFSLSLIIAGIFTLSSAQAITIQHIYTNFANQGYCVASFLVRSEGESAKNIKINMNVLDEQGKKQEEQTLEIKLLEDHGPEAFATVAFESRYACKANLTVEVVSATGTILDHEGEVSTNLKVKAASFQAIQIKVKKQK